MIPALQNLDGTLSPLGDEASHRSHIPQNSSPE
jgi:hypothetical protein